MRIGMLCDVIVTCDVIALIGEPSVQNNSHSIVLKDVHSMEKGLRLFQKEDSGANV